MRLVVAVLVVVLTSASLGSGHNITKILADHPEFSTFSHYLTATHLATEINRRLTITVLALDNSAMSSLLAHHFSLPTLKNVLSLHILVDYYGTKKLHQITGGTAVSSSFFQSTGAAPGTTGFINITDQAKGHVTFAAEDDSGVASTSTSSFVKAIKEMPYNISIIQISAPLSSPEAEAPAAAPAPVNLTSVLAKNGCKLFADLLSATSDVLKTYEENQDGGLTVFCPVDGAVKSFAPKFKNLTAEAKASLLLYHGEPVYNSMQQLKDFNGISTTLASEGAKKSYHFTIQNDGDLVTVETKVNTAKIQKTVLDRDPVAIYSIDKVLEPKELFKVPKAQNAEAPAPEAEAPAKAHGKKKKKKATPAVEAPSPAGPDGAPADEKAADENAAARKQGWGRTAVVSVAMALAVII